MSKRDIKQFIAFFLLVVLMFMCNTKHKSKEKALFIKLCKIDSSTHEVDCRVYLFQKIDTSRIDVGSKDFLDSMIKQSNSNFIGENAKNVSFLHYIDSDTINFYIYGR